MTILAEHRIQAINIIVVIRVSATNGEDGPRQQVGFVGNKREAFDIMTEKETFFQAKHAIKRNPGKFPVVEMSSAFDPFVDARPP